MSIINDILGLVNRRIIKIKKNKFPEKYKNKILLNLGSGNWSSEGWINLDRPSEWYSKDQSRHAIVAYDIRKNRIPFEDNSVDVIYCSHVIEHIENEHITNMFNECFRVLKKEGIFRICCPDAEFLYQVSLFDNDFWLWRYDWFKSNKNYDQSYRPEPIDCLVSEIATPKLLHYTNSITSHDYKDAFNTMEMVDFFEYLTSDLKFRDEFPGEHINYWTFDKIYKFLSAAGFKNIIRSKKNASICSAMQNTEKFDTTCPIISVYVEAVK